MQEIHYTVQDKTGKIAWAAAEEFEELRGQRFDLNQMEATQIEKLDDFSLTAKLLLSAIAGAIIQHLNDREFEIAEIFETGFFIVE